MLRKQLKFIGLLQVHKQSFYSELPVHSNVTKLKGSVTYSYSGFLTNMTKGLDETLRLKGVVGQYCHFQRNDHIGVEKQFPDIPVLFC